MIIHGQQDQPPRRKADTPKLVSACIMLLMFLFGFVYCLQGGAQYTREVQQYQAAPLCTSTNPMDNASATCRLDTPMTVTDKWNEDISSSGRRSSTHLIDWKVELRTASGSTYQAEYYGGDDPPNGYRSASIGATVEAERWQDKVVRVSINGVIHHTHYYRGDVPGQTSHMTNVYFFSSICFVFLIVSIILLVSLLNGKFYEVMDPAGTIFKN